MGKASRDKGKRGELEAAELLNSWGFHARRSVQFAGRVWGHDSGQPDLHVEEDAFLHIEVKRTERPLVHEWLKVLKRDAAGAMGIILHKRNRDEWCAIMPAATLEKLLKAYYGKDEGGEAGPEKKEEAAQAGAVLPVRDQKGGG